jgi:hypothetical protein
MQIWEKTLLVLAVGAAMLIGVGGTFTFVWTAGKLEVSTPMLISVAIIGVVTNALAPLRYLLSGINRHRGTAIAEIASGVLAVLFSFAAVSALSADAVGWGIVVASACTTAWMLPAQASLHIGMGRLLPTTGRLLKIALVAVAVCASARWMAAVGAQLAPGNPWTALIMSGLAAAAACTVGVLGLKLIDWRTLSARFWIQGT